MYIVREYLAEFRHRLTLLFPFLPPQGARFKKLPKKQKRYLAAFSIALSIVVAVFSYLVFTPTGTEDTKISIEIPFGLSLGKAVSDLEERNLIKDRRLFYALVYMQGFGANIKAGEYEFSPNLSQWRIAAMLSHGITKTYQITIPENWTTAQIARRLEAQRLANYTVFMELARDPAFLAEMKIPGKSAEGFLYPETYSFDRMMGERRIMMVMIGRFWKVFTPQLEFRAKELGVSVLEIVTLASIIGKEAKIEEEKPLVAAVFHNRLHLGMRLQSDPTAVYDFERPRRQVTPKDLRKRSKHNTYLIKGLPSGPIANPSNASILAALYPADVDYLYFVHARNGSHIFSRDYRDHVNAIRTLYRREERGTPPRAPKNSTKSEPVTGKTPPPPNIH